MPEKKKRCQHDPIRIFEEPSKTDLAGWLFYSSKARWVRCSKCGITGYWGGYGHKRRVRWGYGYNIEEDARQWSAWIAERRCSESSVPEPAP